MTRDEVLAMAEQAGASPIYEKTNRLPGVLTIDADALKRFHALAFEAGRKAEREECVKICEEVRKKYKPDFRFALNDCIDDIRARSAK